MDIQPHRCRKGLLCAQDVLRALHKLSLGVPTVLGQVGVIISILQKNVKPREFGALA